MDIQSLLKQLPSVERVLEMDDVSRASTLLSRKGITRIIRDTISSYRQRIREGERFGGDADSLCRAISDDVIHEIGSLSTDRMRPVINATGVVLHTNLGRAVLGAEACAAVESAASGYVDLEMDVESGERVDRSRRARRLVSLVTGAQDALVVNNNAAAVLLAVDTFAGDGAVAISRGELVEIGGSFRLPEILAKAAGRVIEVGTTNRTHFKDYERAIDEGATLLLKVHTSNYKIVGYTNEVSLADLAGLGAARGVPTMYDQGNGVIYPLDLAGIEGEESVQSLLDSGTDLISFSADKVLGATQGGIVVGSADLITRMRTNHLSRALRVDKLTLAGLERVLVQYWNAEFDGIPALAMITMKPDTIKKRAEHLVKKLQGSLGDYGTIRVAKGESAVGGGSYPVTPLETVLVEIELADGLAGTLAKLLRMDDHPVMVRAKGDSIYVDLRTVSRDEEPVLADRLLHAIRSSIGRE
jgi:L-seryl-tRNA(Ser) seleniumtransferase